MFSLPAATMPLPRERNECLSTPSRDSLRHSLRTNKKSLLIVESEKSEDLFGLFACQQMQLSPHGLRYRSAEDVVLAAINMQRRDILFYFVELHFEGVLVVSQMHDEPVARLRQTQRERAAINFL